MAKTVSVLVTGGGGYIGSQVVKALAADRGALERIIAVDIRPPGNRHRLDGVEYVNCDIRSTELADVMKRFRTDTVVHLAAVVTPGRKSNREFEYSVDVLGTKNVLECCMQACAERFIYTSSGAAYGYHSDNPQPLDEYDPLRGNPEFAYSDHKRQVEEMLATSRVEHPEIEQLIFRPGTVLGTTTSNQITDLFDGRFVMGLSGASSPFVLIWDQDVAAAIVKGIHEGGSGIYNMAGDGTLTLKEIAEIMGKPYIPIPVGLVRTGLAVMKKFGLTQYGPEQVDFLRYRPVLSNRRLKEEFGYTPQKTTREVFEFFLEARRNAQ